MIHCPSLQQWHVLSLLIARMESKDLASGRPGARERLEIPKIQDTDTWVQSLTVAKGTDTTQL